VSDRDGSGDRVADDLLRAGIAWMETVGRAAGELGGGPGEGGAKAGRGREDLAGLVGTMARAQLAFLTAGLDLGRQLAEVQLRRGMRLGEPLAAALRDGELGERERQALIEEARGYLREVATISLDEARNLSRTLADIDRRLHAQAGGGEEEPPRRRWSAKE
jgi:hypothetical protein